MVGQSVTIFGSMADLEGEVVVFGQEFLNGVEEYLLILFGLIAVVDG